MRRTFLKMLTAVLFQVVLLGAAHAATAEPRLVVPERPVPATAEFRWRFPIKIMNPMEYGLFVDSLWADVMDLDAGETGRPKLQRIPLNMAVRSRPSISAGDSMIFAYAGNAMAEKAKLTIRLHAHTGDGRKFLKTALVEMTPAPQIRQMPSEKIMVAGRAIELVRINGTGGGQHAGPGVVIVHGDGSSARRMIPTAWSAASLGFSVVLVSLPGYGLSPGPTEFGGPVTIRAIAAALDTLRGMQGVDATRIGLWAVGPGATAAAFVAARDTSIAAIVLCAGIYDADAALRDTRSAKLRELILRDAGKDASSRRLRSPLEHASSLGMPVMLVHSPADSVAPIAQAEAYEAALRSNGSRVKLLQEVGAGHFGVPDATDDPSLVFLRDRVLMRHVLPQ